MMKFFVLAALLVLIVMFFKRNADNKAAAVENIAAGKLFLAENKQVDGVIETASGLQYQVLQDGEGDGEHPSAKSKVKVHYHGTLLSGEVFDSSVERGQPISFGLNQVIKGWTEGVQLMKVGDKFRFFIPADLAYGNSSAGKIKPGSLLIFDVELLAIH